MAQPASGVRAPTVDTLTQQMNNLNVGGIKKSPAQPAVSAQAKLEKFYNDQALKVFKEVVTAFKQEEDQILQQSKTQIKNGKIEFLTLPPGTKQFIFTADKKPCCFCIQVDPIRKKYTYQDFDKKFDLLNGKQKAVFVTVVARACTTIQQYSETLHKKITIIEPEIKRNLQDEVGNLSASNLLKKFTYDLVANIPNLQ